MSRCWSCNVPYRCADHDSVLPIPTYKTPTDKIAWLFWNSPTKSCARILRIFFYLILILFPKQKTLLRSSANVKIAEPVGFGRWNLFNLDFALFYSLRICYCKCPSLLVVLEVISAMMATIEPATKAILLACKQVSFTLSVSVPRNTFSNPATFTIKQLQLSFMWLLVITCFS